MGEFIRLSDATRLASQMEYVCKLQQNADCMYGRMVHHTSIAGIQSKYAEIQNKIKRLKSLPNPDLVQIERLNKILSHLESTLSRCR